MAHRCVVVEIATDLLTGGGVGDFHTTVQIGGEDACVTAKLKRRIFGAHGRDHLAGGCGLWSTANKAEPIDAKASNASFCLDTETDACTPGVDVATRASSRVNRLKAPRRPQ